jgi:hypothetical protein
LFSVCFRWSIGVAAPTIVASPTKNPPDHGGLLSEAVADGLAVSNQPARTLPPPLPERADRVYRLPSQPSRDRVGSKCPALPSAPLIGIIGDGPVPALSFDLYAGRRPAVRDRYILDDLGRTAMSEIHPLKGVLEKTQDRHR